MCSIPFRENKTPARPTSLCLSWRPVCFLFLLRREPAANNMSHACKPKQEAAEAAAVGVGKRDLAPTRNIPSAEATFNARLLSWQRRRLSTRTHREGLLNSKPKEHPPISLLLVRAVCSLHANWEPSLGQSQAIPLLTARLVSPTSPPPPRKTYICHKPTSTSTVSTVGVYV